MSFLVVEGGFGRGGHADDGPGACGVFAALDFVAGYGAAFRGFFPVEENPAFALARGFEVEGLAGEFGAAGYGGGSAGPAERAQLGVVAGDGIFGVTEDGFHVAGEVFAAGVFLDGGLQGGGSRGHDLIAEGGEGIELGLKDGGGDGRRGKKARIGSQPGDDVLCQRLDFGFADRKTRHLSQHPDIVALRRPFDGPPAQNAAYYASDNASSASNHASFAPDNASSAPDEASFAPVEASIAQYQASSGPHHPSFASNQASFGRDKASF